MGKIDFDRAGECALFNIEALLADIIPGGKVQGNEYTVLNPTRNDSRAGSFKVNVRTGVWSDFATGDKGDIIGLYGYVNGVSNADAAAAILERYGGDAGAPKKKKRNTHTWTPILPVPSDAAEPPKAHPHYGRPSMVWPYRDHEGNLLGYTWRINHTDGSKDIIPLTYCHNESGAKKWQFRSWERPRPLFGLDRIDNAGYAIVVEGEKCADALYNLMRKSIPVISWPGGGNAVDRADWSPLYGIDTVVIWPDADDDGAKAARSVARALDGKVKSLFMVEPPDDAPKGWDVADAIEDGWTAVQVQSFMQQRQHTPQWDDSGGGSAGGRKIPPQDDFAAPASAPVEWNHTDYGGALRLASTYGRFIRYNARPFGRWFWYDDTRWTEDVTNRIYLYVDQMIKDILSEASQLYDGERKALTKWALRLEAMSRQKAVIAKAETLQDLSVRVDQLDADGNQFNCRNVTLDLHDGEVVPRDHSITDYITKLSPVVYDPLARCHQWEIFLSQTFDGNEELIEYVKRCVGYSLVADVSEQCLFFCYGTGANGKSVFFETLRYLFGDYGGKAPTEMLMQQQFNQVPTDVADLRGKRFVVASEVDDGKRWAESRLKDLTGGDTIKARRMREDFFEFEQTHKLWVFGNHKPVLRGTDEGIRRRIRIIPFTVTVPEKQRIPMGKMLATFRSEASGILNWALNGYMSWYEHQGLGTPETVISATNDYFDENDIMQQFIDECCITGSMYSSSDAHDLYKRYHGWCESNGIRSLSSKGFYRVLSEKGYEKRSGTGNRTVFDGIAIDDLQKEMHDH